MIPLRTPLATVVFATFFAFCAVVCVAGIVKLDVGAIVAFPLFISLACGFYRSAYLQYREDTTLKPNFVASLDLDGRTSFASSSTGPEGSTWQKRNQPHSRPIGG